MLLKPRTSAKEHKAVKGPDILAFFTQLTTLFHAGTPLMEALRIASTQTESTRLAEIIRQVANKVAAGVTLSDALAEYDKHFKREWLEVIKSGEHSGELGTVLSTLTKQIDAAAQLRTKLLSAMMYPMILLVVAVGAVAVMLIQVVPTFAQMFDSFGKELPGITQAVLGVSDFLQEHVLAIVGTIVVVTFGSRRYVATEGGRRVWHGLLISMPVIGEVMVQACMQKFANNCSLLLRAGLPLFETIGSLRGIFESNVIYQGALGGIQSQIGSGGQLAVALEETGLFTSFVINMTRTGEESGTLMDVLDQVDEFYSRKVATVVERVSGTLETVIILFMGVAIAVILCAVYLPLFSMASAV